MKYYLFVWAFCCLIAVACDNGVEDANTLKKLDSRKQSCIESCKPREFVRTSAWSPSGCLCKVEGE